ncbi:MAG TPA: fatty acid--CoA ligase [Chloroflexota bacterium]|nr:fatty acid--CoA ligase [Chloroflexota bacterium]
MPTGLIERTANAYAYPLLIKHLLHPTETYAHKQEIVYRDVTRFSYATLRRRIGQLAGGLASLGVKPGDTVGVMDWDSHRYLECYFAVPMMGAVLHTLNVRLSPDQIRYTIEHAEDDVLLVHADFLPILEAMRKAGLTRARTVVFLRDDPSEPAGSEGFAAEYEELVRSADPGYAFPDFDENTRATTFYTTGTTGLPKGVYFSHRQLVLHTLATMAALAAPAEGQRFHRGDVYMPITPMFHVHAWGMPYIATALGVKQVYPGRYVPELLLDLIRNEGVTFSHCVPTILHMLLTNPAARNVDLSRWKIVIGGSALPRSLAKAACERGIDVFGGYGMSETCPVLTIAYLDPVTLERDIDVELSIRTRAGRPTPLVDLHVVDSEMRDVPHDGASAGEVVVRAPWLTQGYLNDREGSQDLWAGGYLHTRDIGTIDAAGYLRVTDRMKDVIKTGGEWISSLDLEDIIGRHAAVSEAAVIAVPDPKWVERPLAIVVLDRDHPETTEDEIRKHVATYAERGAISRFAIPERILFVESIDKTSVGKLDKKLLRQRFGRPTEPDPGAEDAKPSTDRQDSKWPGF